MPSGFLANRLIGALLAVALLCPSWMWGSCCCTRKALAKTSGTSQTRTEVRSQAKKSCCAARAMSPKSDRSEYDSDSPCRCRIQVKSVALSGSVRTLELTTHINYFVIAERASRVLVGALPSNQQSLRSIERGDPPDPLERCAQLCRWLA